MSIPVSVRTDHDLIRDLADTPRLGAWVIVLLALGPPTVLGVLAWILDVAQQAAGGAPWGVRAAEAPYLGPAYFALVFGSAIPFNLMLAYRFGVKIRILYLPAWAFGALALVLLAVFGVEGA